MSIDRKEIIRLEQLQIGKKCKKCKIGTYYRSFYVRCDNCGETYIDYKI